MIDVIVYFHWWVKTLRIIARGIYVCFSHNVPCLQYILLNVQRFLFSSFKSKIHKFGFLKILQLFFFRFNLLCLLKMSTAVYLNLLGVHESSFQQRKVGNCAAEFVEHSINLKLVWLALIFQVTQQSSLKYDKEREIYIISSSRRKFCS